MIHKLTYMINECAMCKIIKSLLVLILLNCSLFAVTPVFEKVEKNLLPSGDFKDNSWQTDWKWNKNNKHFAVTGKQVDNKNVLELSYSSVTDRGQISTPGFSVPAGTVLKISLSAKAQNFDGGVWVNLEQPNEKPVAEQAELFLAGGDSDWVEYEHRLTVAPKGISEGSPVKLKLWLYMYGKGKILLENIKVEIISEDTASKNKWIVSRINELSKKFGTPSKKIQATATPIAILNDLTQLHSRKLTQSPEWGILTTHSMARVNRELPFIHDYSQSVKLEMVRHEYEGVQICLFSSKEDLQNVELSSEGLTGPAILDKSNIEILPIAYGDATKVPDPGFFNSKDSNWLPDALLTNRMFNIEKEKVQPVYIRFYIPRETKPGVYKGKILVKTDKGSCSVPVEINVHSYTLPTRLTLKTMLLGGKGAKDEDRHYLDLALQNRMPPGKIFTGMSWTNPTFPRKGNSYDFSDVERRLQYAIDRGLNSFAMCTTAKSGKYGFPKEYSKDWKRKMSHMVREYSNFLEKKGWLDMAYYYNIDEPWNTRWNQVKDIYEMVKKVNPKIKVLSCVNKVGALEALKNHADVFDVYMQQYHRQQGEARKKDGKEMWWAVCIWPDEKPNLFLTSPLSEARIIGWLSYYHGIDGFEYWDMNSWSQDWKKGTGQKAPSDESWLANEKGYLTSQWPYPHTRAGDGYLVYPGNNNKALNSLRFESLRDGLEEHEMMSVLSKSGNASTVRKLLNYQIKNVHVFDNDPKTMILIRNKIIQLLK